MKGLVQLFEEEIVLVLVLVLGRESLVRFASWDGCFLVVFVGG